MCGFISIPTATPQSQSPPARPGTTCIRAWQRPHPTQAPRVSSGLRPSSQRSSDLAMQRDFGLGCDPASQAQRSVRAACRSMRHGAGAAAPAAKPVLAARPVRRPHLERVKLRLALVQPLPVLPKEVERRVSRLRSAAGRAVHLTSVARRAKRAAGGRRRAVDEAAG